MTFHYYPTKANKTKKLLQNLSFKIKFITTISRSWLDLQSIELSYEKLA